MTAVTAYRRQCAKTYKQPVVSQTDYLSCVDQYYVISTSGSRARRACNYRWLQCVFLKYRRTSINGRQINPNTYPVSAVIAFASHSKIGSPFNGRQVRNPVVGRREGHYSRRYLTALVSDMFGYARHRLAPSTAPLSRSSCAPERLQTPIIASQVN